MKNSVKNSLIVYIVIFLTIFVLSAIDSYAEPSYRIEDGKIEKTLEKCKVSITYPIVKDYSHQNSQEKINKIFKDYVGKLEKEFLDTYEKEKNEIDAERKWDLTAIYEAKEQGDVLSVVMFSGEYVGGAHPNPSLETFVYSMSKAKLYSLKDLFKPDSEYLKKIAGFCEKDLLKRKVSDEQWVKEGTQPKEDNYQFFYLNKKGLVIIFPQYQVAPYSEGNQEVTVPYSELKDIMSSDAPMAK